jgi:hypothetical protein
MPIAGNKYTEDNFKTLVRQTNQWLLRLHKNSLQEVVDFEILAVFIMQEMDDDLDIRKLVEMLIIPFFWLLKAANHLSKPTLGSCSGRPEKNPIVQ